MIKIYTSDVSKLYVGSSAVSKVYVETTQVWPNSAPDYSTKYFTFSTISAGTYTFSGNALDYSTDNGSTWTTLPSNTSTPTINAGTKVLWRATGLTPTSGAGIGTFSSTAKFNVEGNIMSLHFGDNFTGQTSLSGLEYAYKDLFKNASGLTSAENLVLPATTLSKGCYNNMFRHCSGLTSTPELPATAMTQYCYQDMFSNCTSLTTAPELPASTLAAGCYYYMFAGCTGITSAPVLSATTLSTACYQGMFSGCTNLNYIKMTAEDITASNSLNNWVVNVATAGTFVKYSTTTLSTGNSGIPNGWIVENEGPVHDYSQDYTTLSFTETGTFKLSGNSIDYSTDDGSTWTTLANNTVSPTMSAGTKVRLRRTHSTGATGKIVTTGRYVLEGNSMSLVYGDNFTGQTSLSGHNLVFEQLFASNSGLTSAENFILPATTLAQGCYKEIFMRCSSLTSAPVELPATTLEMECYAYMFHSCTSLMAAPELPATTLAMGCYRMMFAGCTSLMAAPELPATTLTYGCYNAMFYGCSSLEAIKCMAEGWIDTNGCTNSWVMGVAANGIFIKALNSNWDTGDNGIPSGWDVQIDTPFE